MSPQEKAAFDIRALQTQLLVAGLNCREEGLIDRYNAFISRFQRDLAGHANSLRGWFRKAHGARSEVPFNSYITDLANVQSQVSTRQGAAYCARVAPLFQQALAVPSARELPAFAAAQALPQPMPVEACEIRSATTTPPPKPRR